LIIDLHTHTFPLSDDSQLELPQLVNLARQAGLDAICLTEHDWFRKKDAVVRLCQEHDFLILPGIGMNTEEGHFLVLGLEKYIFGMHRAKFLKQVVDEAGGVMILAHPYRRQLRSSDDFEVAVEQYRNEPIFHLVDTVETHNGRAMERQNRFSQELCRRLSLKGVGGSDAHSKADIPSCATFFQKEISNVEELIAELKAGRFRAVDLRESAKGNPPLPFHPL